MLTGAEQLALPVLLDTGAVCQRLADEKGIFEAAQIVDAAAPSQHAIR